MCVARLYVSTQSCGHRWYHLVRPCNSANNLQNCPEKLQLEGWESRTSDCPWCDGTTILLSESTHRLLGSTQSGTSTPSSPTLSDTGNRVPQRRNSSGTVSSLTPLSRQSSAMSTESDRLQRDRDMNDRLHMYINSHPHEVLPSAAKNYPTYPQWQSVQSSAPAPVDASIVRRHSRALSAQWKRRFRSSVSFVKGFTVTDVSGTPL